VVASIFYDDYKIDEYMPVNGKIISINGALLSNNKNIGCPQKKIINAYANNNSKRKSYR
jgi:hypothetical protein